MNAASPFFPPFQTAFFFFFFFSSGLERPPRGRRSRVSRRFPPPLFPFPFFSAGPPFFVREIKKRKAGHGPRRHPFPFSFNSSFPLSSTTQAGPRSRIIESQCCPGLIFFLFPPLLFYVSPSFLPRHNQYVEHSVPFSPFPLFLCRLESGEISGALIPLFFPLPFSPLTHRLARREELRSAPPFSFPLPFLPRRRAAERKLLFFFPFSLFFFPIFFQNPGV